MSARLLIVSAFVAGAASLSALHYFSVVQIPSTRQAAGAKQFDDQIATENNQLRSGEAAAEAAEQAQPEAITIEGPNCSRSRMAMTMYFVDCTVTADQLTISNVKFNRGNCVMSDFDNEMADTRWRGKTFKFGEAFRIAAPDDCNLIEIEMVAGENTWTYTFN